MKTLLITLEYPPFNGGVANYYANLVKYWPKNESIKVVDNSRGELFSGTGPFPWFKTIVVIWKNRRNKTFDYLLIGHILPLGTAAFIVSLIMPVKYAVILHGLDFTSAISTFRKKIISSLILKRADKVICANSYVAGLVKELDINLSKKIIVKNPGVEVSQIKVEQSRLESIKKDYSLENSIIILSIGRLVLRKGFDKMIEALSLIKDEPIKYFIIGVGEKEKYLKDLVTKLNLNDKVFFLGSLSQTDKHAWLEVSDIFAMPARRIGKDFEGFGIVYLEANLHSKPVIAGQSGGIEDAVVDGKTGLLVNPENANEISKLISLLSKNRELRERLGKQGKERVVSEFNWENQSRKFYESLIS